MKIKFILFLFSIKSFFKKLFCKLTNKYYVDDCDDLRYLLKQKVKKSNFGHIVEFNNQGDNTDVLKYKK